MSLRRSGVLFFAPKPLSDGRNARGEKPSKREGHPVPSPTTSVKDVDDHTPVKPNGGGLGNGADRVGHTTAFADHAPQITLGNADLIDQIPVLFQLLDLDSVRVLDQRPDEELQ